MKDKDGIKILFEGCPLGCQQDVIQLDIQLPEGYVRKCKNCGHLFSSCSSEQFYAAVGHWNHRGDKKISSKDLARQRRRKKKDFLVMERYALNSQKPMRLLDVGCLDGVAVSIFNELGVRAEGIDPSSEAVEIGRRNGLNLHVGYLHELEFPESSYDVVTLYEVIEHLEKPVDLFEEIARILKSGGVLVVGTGNVDSWTAKFKKEKWDFFGLYSRGGHVSFFSPRTLGYLAQKTGFEVIFSRTYTVKFLERSEAPWLLYRSAKLLSELLSWPARLFGKGHQMEVYLRRI